MGLVTTNDVLGSNKTALGTGYHNIFYDWVLAGMKTTLNNEFKAAEIYIAPNIKEGAIPFSIRIWGTSANTEEHNVSRWTKEYNLDVCAYFIEKNPNENFYKQFYNDAEHLYQVLFNNKVLNITKSVTPAGSVTGTQRFTWINGTVGSIEINEYAEGEEEIDGLHKITLDFSCIVEREG